MLWMLSISPSTVFSLTIFRSLSGMMISSGPKDSRRTVLYHRWKNFLVVPYVGESLALADICIPGGDDHRGALHIPKPTLSVLILHPFAEFQFGIGEGGAVAQIFPEAADQV